MEHPVLCLVCKSPSAVFSTEKDKMTGKEHRYRLAKTMRRVTAKGSTKEHAYVHEDPCLQHLVSNWASYIVDGQIKDRSTLSNETDKQADSGHSGENAEGLAAPGPLP